MRHLISTLCILSQLSLPAAAAQEVTKDQYIQKLIGLVRERMNSQKRPKLSQTEKVVISFTINRSGTIMRVDIKTKSHSSLADDAAVSLFQVGEEIKPFPSDVASDKITFTLPVSYNVASPVQIANSTENKSSSKCDAYEIKLQSCIAVVARQSGAQAIADQKYKDLAALSSACASADVDANVDLGLASGRSVGKISIADEAVFISNIKFRCSSAFASIGSKPYTPPAPTPVYKILSDNELDEIESKADFSGSICSAGRYQLMNAIMSWRSEGIPVSNARDTFDGYLKTNRDAWIYMVQSVNDLYRDPIAFRNYVRSGGWSKWCVKAVRGY